MKRCAVAREDTYAELPQLFDSPFHGCASKLNQILPSTH
jgi:hypothetical protein